MAVGRYVVVSADTSDKVIKEGPMKCDLEVYPYDPGPGLVLMLESEALADGYTWPVYSE